jgi:hypothetical protein
MLLTFGFYFFDILDIDIFYSHDIEDENMIDKLKISEKSSLI